MTQIPDWLHVVGPGWHPLLVQLHEDIVSVDPRYTVFQVKHKFGSLRAYIDSSNPQAAQFAIATERRANQTCEVCGEPGSIQRLGRIGLFACLCELHFQEHEHRQSS